MVAVAIDMTLGALIRAAMVRAGYVRGDGRFDYARLTYDVQMRIREPVASNYISRIASGDIKQPDKTKLLGLAAELGLDIPVVSQLAGYMGLEQEELVAISVGDLNHRGVFHSSTLVPRSWAEGRDVAGFRVTNGSFGDRVPLGSVVFVDRGRALEPGDLVVAWGDKGQVLRVGDVNADVVMLADSEGGMAAWRRSNIEGVVGAVTLWL